MKNMNNIKGKEILTPDHRLKEACEALRHHVEHPNESSDILLYGGIYKHKDPEAISTITCDGVVIGYKVKMGSPLLVNHTFTRTVFVKIPGERLDRIPIKDLKAIMAALFDVFLDSQQNVPTITPTGVDALRIDQEFQVGFFTEKNPDLRSIAGGVDLDVNGMIIQ